MNSIDSILNPTVFIGSFEWREPITTLTDFLVALCALFAFIYFYKRKKNKPSIYSFYMLYFLCFAIGMTCASWLGHGLQAYVGPEYKRVGWFCSATGHLFLAFASLIQIKSYLSKWVLSSLQVVYIIQYIIFIVLMLHPKFSDFIYAQISSTVSLVILILPLQIINYIKTKNNGSLLMVSAILYGIIPGTIYNNQVSISKWFNYHDISHVLMAIFMVIMFISVKKINNLQGIK